jgi:hypothetical protein
VRAVAEKSVTYRLLSLFASPDRAESIEGDLIEERHTYGRLWFAINVVTTALALWRQALALDFLRTVALSVVAVALSCLVCEMLELLRVELALGPSPVPTLLLIPVFALLLGAGLVRVAPTIGVSAAAAASLFLLLMFFYAQIAVRTAQLHGMGDVGAVTATFNVLAFFIRDCVAAAVLYLLPLNVGSVLMHGCRPSR